MAWRSWRGVAIGFVLPLAFACSGSHDGNASVDEGTVLEAPRPGDLEKSPFMFAGQLRSIDPGKKRLIAAFADDLYEFTYTDSTEVVGAGATVQGLTGKAGSEITVYYRQSPITSTKTATRIELH